MAEPGRNAVEQAAAWHSQLGDGPLNEEDRRDFDAWLAVDPMHLTAFERMNRIGDKMAPADPVTHTALREMYRASSPKRTLLGVLLVTGIMGSAWMLADNSAIRARIAEERTTHGQQKSTTLASRDHITIDSDSALDIDDGERTIRLWRGAVMAKVSHGPTLPFIVKTAHGTAQALGTQFSVRVEGDATIVAVVASHVRACASLADTSCVTLGPGEAIRLDPQGAHPLSAMDAQVEEGWADGLLVADDLPLSRILHQLNRYRATPIRYDAADLKGLSMSGTLPLTDSRQALAGIGAALPVEIETTTTGTTIRRR